MAGTDKAPAKETGADRFKRVASIRVSKAIEAIERAGKVSGDHTEAQVAAIETALNGAVSKAVSALRASLKGAEKPTSAQRFTL